MRGRLAPTPSGRMHLGNAFAALLSWLSVRSQGGKLLLRVEDLDTQRCRAEYKEALLRDLTWLGLYWDEGPVYQSARTSFYENCFSTLEQKKLLYPCFCSRAQLHTALAPHENDGFYIYSGRCRPLQHHVFPLQNAAVRIIVPCVDIFFKDGCQGNYTQDLQKDCGDFILRRSDGVYAYQLATPVDDCTLQVSEIVRGRDLLSSTPRQIWLMQELDYIPPHFYHIPLLLAPDGRRLAKRDGDLEIATLRDRGWHPAEILGLLAFWAGLLPKWEAVCAQDLIPLFNWNKIPINDIYLPQDFPSPSS